MPAFLPAAISQIPTRAILMCHRSMAIRQGCRRPSFMWEATKSYTTTRYAWPKICGPQVAWSKLRCGRACRTGGISSPRYCPKRGRRLRASEPLLIRSWHPIEPAPRVRLATETLNKMRPRHSSPNKIETTEPTTRGHELSRRVAVERQVAHALCAIRLASADHRDYGPGRRAIRQPPPQTVD